MSVKLTFIGIAVNDETLTMLHKMQRAIEKNTGVPAIAIEDTITASIKAMYGAMDREGVIEHD